MFSRSTIRAFSITRLGTTDPRMSQIVKHNNTVYLSGQVPSPDAFGKDITTQVKTTLEKVDILLEEAGTSKSNLLSAQIWVI